MYGHFGQGCVHMRINFDFETEAGILAVSRSSSIAPRTSWSAHGGSLSGEHGDGQSRAALLPKMFGPELMQAFREFKRIWDPDNRMNPGKLVDAAPAPSKICASAPTTSPGSRRHPLRLHRR